MYTQASRSCGDPEDCSVGRRTDGLAGQVELGVRAFRTRARRCESRSEVPEVPGGFSGVRKRYYRVARTHPRRALRSSRCIGCVPVAWLVARTLGAAGSAREDRRAGRASAIEDTRSILSLCVYSFFAVRDNMRREKSAVVESTIDGLLTRRFPRFTRAHGVLHSATPPAERRGRELRSTARSYSRPRGAPLPPARS